MGEEVIRKSHSMSFIKRQIALFSLIFCANVVAHLCQCLLPLFVGNSCSMSDSYINSVQ